MSRLPGFPNPETIVVLDLDTWQGLLDEDDPDRFTTDTVTPADLQDRLPLVTINRRGGAMDEIQDYPVVDVAVHGKTYNQVNDIAEAIRARLLSGYMRNQHGLIDRFECITPHQEDPDADPGIRKVVTSYIAVARRLPMSTLI